MKDFLNKGEPLTSFRQQGITQLFTIAETYPDFFRDHLLDPNRVIKVFQDDPNANERVFYYQYLKICEDYENLSSQQRIQNMKQFVLNDQLTILFPEQNLQPPFTDDQFKRIIYQFMNLIHEGQIGVDDALKQYPFVDIVFVYLMRTLLILNDKAQTFDQFIDRNQTFAYLSSIFDIQIQLFDNCIKFSDADIFVYQEIPNQVYMAYIIGQENQGSIQLSDRKKNNNMFMSDVNGPYEFVDFTTGSGEDREFDDKYQSKLSSNKMLNNENINRIDVIKEEQLKTEHQPQNEELLDDYEIQFQIPNQSIKYLPQLKDQEQIIEEKNKEIINQQCQRSQQIQIIKEQKVLNNVQEVYKFVTDKEVKQIKQQNISAYSNKFQNRIQNKKLIQHQTSKKYQQIQVQDKQIINSIDIYKSQSTQYRKNNQKLSQGQKKFNFQNQQVLSTPQKLLNRQNIKNKDSYSFLSSSKLNLDVTSQFTNSFLLNKISQPYKTKIKQTKQRARMYRKSLNLPIL